MLSAYAIICLGKNDMSVPSEQQKTHEVATRGFFYSVLARVAYALGWLPILVIAIQPFANIVGNYTCHDRNDKRYEYIHEATPPSLPV